MATGCPDDQKLALYASRRLAEEERLAIEAHLAGCSDCCDVVAFVLKCQTEIPVFDANVGQCLGGRERG